MWSIKTVKERKTALRRSLLETFAMVLYLLAFAISTRLLPDTEKQMLSILLSQTLISLCWANILSSWTVCVLCFCVFVCVSFWAVELLCNEGMTACLQTLAVNYTLIYCVRTRIWVCGAQKQKEGNWRQGIHSVCVCRGGIVWDLNKTKERHKERYVVSFKII